MSSEIERREWFLKSNRLARRRSRCPPHKPRTPLPDPDARLFPNFKVAKVQNYGSRNSHRLSAARDHPSSPRCTAPRNRTRRARISHPQLAL